MAQLIACPSCNASVSSIAAACPHCGHPFSGSPRTVQVQVRKRTSGCAVVAAIVFGLALFIFFASLGEQNTASQVTAPAIAQAQASGPAKAATANSPNSPEPALWDYKTKTDSMSGQPARIATLWSVNKINFGFPYQGDQRGTLLVATYPRLGHQVRLSIERGQFICNSFDNCTVAVRFDQGKPIRMRAVEPADHDTTTIFIVSTHSFVDRLKHAKEVRVEATFFQQGNQVLEFHTQGFDPTKAGF